MKQITGFYPGGEIEFLRKRNNKNLHRTKKIKSIRLKSFHIILIIAVFIILGYGAFRAGKFITEWRVLSVKSFHLVNSPHFMENKVQNILKSYGGNILTINLEKLRSDLLCIREVRDVNISRKLPSTLQVTFFLRRPVYQIREGNRIKLLDREGIIVTDRIKPENGLIMIKNGKTIDFRRFTPGLIELSSMKSLIEYITYKNPYGLVLKLKNLPELFYTGEKNFIPKIKQFLKLKSKLGLNENRIKAVDLRFNGRFYLEYTREVM